MAKRKNITTTQLALMTAAAVISLRGLPMMAQEELTMFFYIFFATFLFLIPAALVGAELGSAFADRGGGVYTWVKEAFNRHLGFSAIFLQWIQNVVWYPTVLGFAAASIAYMIGVPALAQNGLYVGLFSIAMYWCATLVTLRGTSAISGITSKGFLIGTVLPGVVVIVMAVIWMAGGNEIALKEIPAGVSQIVNVDAATIANRGVMNEPRLVAQITTAQGGNRALLSHAGGRRVLGEDVAARLEKEMIRVVKSGTGKRAALDNGYTVAGKTGSAEASNDKSIESHAWFVGYITNDGAPYAICVLVENGGSGGGVAAPLARKTLQKAIHLGL